MYDRETRTGVPVIYYCKKPMERTDVKRRN